MGPLAVDLKRKVGPFPLYVWIIAGVAVAAALYLRYRQQQDASSGDGQQITGGLLTRVVKGPRGESGKRGRRGRRGKRGRRAHRDRHRRYPVDRHPGDSKGSRRRTQAQDRRETGTPRMANEQGTYALAASEAQPVRADYGQNGARPGPELDSASPASGGPYAAYPTAADLHAVANMDGTEATGNGGSVYTGTDPEDSSGDDVAPRTDPNGRSREVPKMGFWQQTPEGWEHGTHPAGESPAMPGGTRTNDYAVKDTPPTFDEEAHDAPSEEHPAESQEVMGSMRRAPAHLQPAEVD